MVGSKFQWFGMLICSMMAATVFPVYASAKLPPAALYDPVIEAETAAIYQQTAENLSTYVIDANFSPAGDTAATITADLKLEFVNATGDALQALYFRLYPNGAEYGLGGMTVSDTTINDVSVESSFTDTLQTTMMLPLSAALQPDERVTIKLSFVSTIPTNPPLSYGMFSHNDINDVYALAHWMPMLAGYDAEGGWNLESTTTFGDPVFSNASLYDVTLTAPDAVNFATTGSEISRLTQGSNRMTRFQSGPSRDFVMAASANFVSDEATTGETLVRSHFMAGETSGGLEALLLARDAIATFSQLFGVYPYDEFDVVEIDLGNGAAGVEFPGLIFISSDFYDQNSMSRRGMDFDSLIAHEVAHQWWYGMVGNNQYVHAFLDEGLTNYSATLFYEFAYGEAEGKRQVDLSLKLPYLDMLYGDGIDVVVDYPTDSYSSTAQYSVAVYCKGALAFDAIRRAIGDEAFFSSLTQYLESYQFQIAQPEDLQVVFEASSGQDLDLLWQHWFNAAEGTEDYSPADLQQLLQTYT